MTPLTWAVLTAYALSAEGRAVLGLAAHLAAHTPPEHLRHTARVAAEGLGCLHPDGQLTGAGQRAARSAVSRLNLGRAGVGA